MTLDLLRPKMALALLAFLVSAGIAAAQVPPPPQGSQPPPPPNQAGVDQPPGQQDGMEVLARGPIHEAFAEPVQGVPLAGPVIVKAPPPPVEEIPPEQAPQGNMQWIPGYWSWDDDRKDYIWISGVWRQPPPDRNWIPGQWLQVANGWQWTPECGVPWVKIRSTTCLRPLPRSRPPLPRPPTPASIFVPGTWYFLQTRYVWRPGYWVEPQVGWVWIPALCRTPAGYVFLEGHWDFDLSTRGMLFAGLFHLPNLPPASMVLSSDFVVQTNFLMGALFVRPAFRATILATF